MSGSGGRERERGERAERPWGQSGDTVLLRPLRVLIGGQGPGSALTPPMGRLSRLPPRGLVWIKRWSQVMLQAFLRVIAVSRWASHPPSLPWGGQGGKLRSAQPSGDKPPRWGHPCSPHLGLASWWPGAGHVTKETGHHPSRRPGSVLNCLLSAAGAERRGWQKGRGQQLQLSLPNPHSVPRWTDTGALVGGQPRAFSCCFGCCTHNMTQG